MKCLFYLLVICLLSIGCDSEENRSKERLRQIETLKASIDVLERKSDYVTALKACSELIELDSMEASNYENRARYYNILSRRDSNNETLFQLAYNDITKAIILAPNTERYLLRATIAEEFFNDNTVALENFKLAVNVASTFEDILRARTRRAKYSFYILKDTLSAFNDMEFLLENAETNSRAEYLSQLILAHFFMNCKKFNRAEKLLLDALKKPDHIVPGYRREDVARSLVYCKIEQGNYLGALSILESNKLPLEFTNHHKGYCLYKTGKVSEGKKLMLEYKDLLVDLEKGKIYTSKYFLEVFPELITESTKVRTPTWDWPNEKGYERLDEEFLQPTN